MLLLGARVEIAITGCRGRGGSVAPEGVREACTGRVVVLVMMHGWAAQAQAGAAAVMVPEVGVRGMMAA